MTTFSHFPNDIAYIKTLLEQSLNCPIQVVTQKHQFISPDKSLWQWMTDVIDFSKRYPIPQIKISPLNETFIFVSNLTKSEPLTFVIGPTLNKQTTLSEARPPSLNQLLHQAALVHCLLNQQQLPIEDILKENFYNDSMISKLEDKLRQDFTYIRIDDHIHTRIPGDIQYENQLLACVSTGHVNELLEIIDQINPSPLIADHLNETPLQTMKTMVATIIIIASKTARESGLPIALSYKINTFYLQEINKTTDLNPSVQDICQALHFNPSYLARLFKKEMKMTISEFIMQEKIKEAKHLLETTNHSILEICSLLHFTKNFKKLTKKTPKQYRQQYKVLN